MLTCRSHRLSRAAEEGLIIRSVVTPHVSPRLFNSCVCAFEQVPLHVAFWSCVGFAQILGYRFVLESYASVACGYHTNTITARHQACWQNCWPTRYHLDSLSGVWVVSFSWQASRSLPKLVSVVCIRRDSARAKLARSKHTDLLRIGVRLQVYKKQSGLLSGCSSQYSMCLTIA